MSEPARQSSNTFFFDDVVVETDNYRLIKGGKVRALEPRAFDLLVYLIEHRGRTVEKSELFEHIWQQSIVTDSALTQEIRQIRVAICDDAGAPRYIETVPKHGYRFIAEVSESGPESAEAGVERVFNSLAVLPFDNLNRDYELDYFVEGMTDLLITDLGKISALKVISRTSTLQYKESQKSLPQIARELKVRAVVEGAVMRVGERVRITVQLIDAATDQHIWAESYERDVRDVMRLQNAVARIVAEKIRVRMTSDEKSRVGSARLVAPEAYEAYLKGHFFLLKFIPGGPFKAIELFQRAIEIEPDYADAYAGLADAYGHQAFWGIVSPLKTNPEIEMAINKAIEIDQDLGEAHRALAKLEFYSKYDCRAAEKEFRRALELNPNDTSAGTHYALCLATMGRLDEAMALIRRTHELDPLSMPISSIVGYILFVTGQRDEAIEELLKTLEMDPGFPLSHWMLWRFYRLKGMLDQAIDEFRQIPLLYGADIVEAAQKQHTLSGYKDAMLLAAELMAKKFEEKYLPPTQIAMLYIHAGENDLAIDWLERAYQLQDPKMISIGIDPDWENLHPSSRFRQLLRRLKLPLIRKRPGHSW